MKVLVTGATGYLGLHLVKKLLDEKYDVLALSRYKMNYQHPNLKVILSDVIDISDKVKDLDIDAVFHTAAKINFDDSYDGISQIVKDNIMASYQLADFVVNSNIKKIIVSSTCSVYEENYNIENWITESHKLRPWNLYAVSKLSSEWIFESKLKGLIQELVILRYSSIYGQGQKPGSIVPILIRNASSNKAIELFGTGRRIMNYVYIDDVVNANLNCLKQELPFNSVFNIGSQEQITDSELAEKIRRIWKSDSEIQIKNISEKPDTYLNYSVQKAKTTLNYNPISLDEGLMLYQKLNAKV